MNRPSSLTVRLILSAGLWTFFALVAGGILLAVLFRDSVERSFDARLDVFLESLIAGAEYVDGRGVFLNRRLGDPRFDMPYSGWYYQVTPYDGEPLISRSLWDKELNPDLSAVATQPRRYYATGPDGEQLRVVERDINFPEAQLSLRFSIAGATTENEREIVNFVRATVSALAILGVGLIAAVIFQVRYGLRPLRDLQGALGRVRSGDADRLEGDYPNEIAPVVGELNALIDHNAEVVGRARTHVGNLAHALKTPISVLMNESATEETTLGRSVQRQVEVMRRYVDHYLVRARTAASGTVIGSRTLVYPALRSLKTTLERIYADRDLSITVEGGERLNFRGERQDFDEVLGNLMDNACKWAESRVQVSVKKLGGDLVFAVEDDGPGISEEQKQAAFDRGERLDEAVPGSGLGLSIVKDIAGLYGGGVVLERSPLGGLRVVLTLPASADAGQF